MKNPFLKFAFFCCFAFTGIFLACSDENPIAKAEENLDNMQEEARQEHEYWEAQRSSSAAYEACYYGTSNWSDSYCCSKFGLRCEASSSSRKYSSSSYYWYDYSSSSSRIYYTYSSSSSKPYYLTSSKTLKLTLTYYEQLVNMDISDDGDPEVSFSFKFVKITDDTSKASSGTLLDLQDSWWWSGSKTTTATVPAYTKSIYVCPKVIDEDLVLDDDYSSGYCYIVSNVGYLDRYETNSQSDYRNSNLKLEWNWYLY